MKNDATITAERQKLAVAPRLSAVERICAYPWQVGAGRAGHLGFTSAMTDAVTKPHLRWPGDPPS